MNYKEQPEFQYVVYTRKSSEYEDSQIQSLQRQLEDLAELITREKLVVYHDHFCESRSAFHPGREEFSKLVKLTNEGRVNAWLCWHANRLSRNPVDAGTIVYLMDQGKLHHIRTRERVYYNTPTDKFMLQMEFTMSKKDSDDKSAIVRSGIQRRHRRGYPNGYPPPGFTLRGQGKSGHSFWVVDPVRFERVRSVFRRYLKGMDSINTIWEFAAKIGLSTIPRKTLGGRPLSRSAIRQHLLMNPVYAGYFHGIDGQRYKLEETLQRVITEEDFDRVQEILGSRLVSKNRRRPMRPASYRGLIFSPDGYPLGVDVKFQLICDCRKKISYLNRDRCPQCNAAISMLKNPTYLVYTYYVSVRDKKNPNVVARVVSEKAIDKFVIEQVAARMKISPKLRDWAISYLEQLGDSEIDNRNTEAGRLDDFKQLYASKRKRLRELFVSNQISEDEYKGDSAELENIYQEEEKRIILRENCMTDATKAINLAVELDTVIRLGNAGAKFQALKDLGSNLEWDGKNLSITNANCVNVLIETLKLAGEVNPRFEPGKCVDTSRRNRDFEAVRPTLCRGLDSVRT